jgi:hypothetical protein
VNGPVVIDPSLPSDGQFCCVAQRRYAALW